MAQFDESNDMPEEPGIYIIRNIQSNKCYIGSTIDLRRRRFDHFTALQKERHKNPHLQNSFNIYGPEFFEFAIVELVEDKDTLITREQHYIDTLRPEYNISPTAGNTLGVIPSEDTRKKMSLAHKLRWQSMDPDMKHTTTLGMRSSSGTKGMKFSEEVRAKVSAAGKGRVGSPEKRAKLSALHKGRIKSPEERAKLSAAMEGKPSPMKGKKHTEEAKSKVSAARTGITLSEEHRAAIGRAATGKKIHDDDFKANLAERNRQRAGIPHTEEHKAKIAEANRRRHAAARAKREQERLAQAEALLIPREDAGVPMSFAPKEYKPLTLFDID